MQDFQSEIIGFIIVAVLVILLGFYEAKVKQKNK